MRVKYTRVSKAKDLKRKMDVWYGVPESDITYCKKCGKKIWTYWKVRERGELFHKEMKLCAPCYFKS